ncbi:MAG: leucyl/phenylalanyl-tRNA--protein transferase [Chloroflexi bacterium]|nr:leucyl/phenylalanyl-tRNA--protein transferase [Chloroflexota bacterium]MBP8055780.1 leucyl/phenylalanyl-tRNA--protein transferase [Chloroflexota bacterium]
MELTPDILISAYCQGIFPMGFEDRTHPSGTIFWYDPDPRAIIPLDTFHVPRSLQRTLKKGIYEVRFDTVFAQVIRACADVHRGEGVWITPTIVRGYTWLHRRGFAHSVETWREGTLVGGLYGVAVRGLFAGESMFSLEPDASKVALVHLVEHLRQKEFTLLDTQFMTEHLRRFGTVEIARSEYKERLAAALQVDTQF